ncbi:DsbA family protein [Candidatus Woesearchaeota archaeon]|nr:DsbA family protein [Candidatus Woesearchaeota archaeon]
MEKENKENDTLTIKKDTLWKAATAILIVVLVIILWRDYTIPIGNAAPLLSVPSQPSQQIAQPTVVDMNSLVDDDPFKGDANAPVTIVEFSDFECPFCARFHKDTFPQIMKQYIDTGKVKFIYRDFPLSFHPNAQKAAEASECADDQGKFWEMHDTIFEKGVTGGVTSFKQYALDLSLNTEMFNDCLDKGKYASEVQKDIADGSAAGITGTPGFLINGKLVSGAQPFSVFQQVIESELN